jgi:N-acetyl sugar amidotransferase
MRVCSRCVMDETAVDITFNSNGECDYCSDFILAYQSHTLQENKLKAIIQEIKDDGMNKDYDCIVGVSGGVDSSYVLSLAIEYGLRPLAVHLDNGWNSDLAVSNINNLVTKLNVDLYTHVIEWKENKNLQRSFISADVVDIELLMDNAMLAMNYKLAKKYKLRYILSGSNAATEGIKMPKSWNWLKFDAWNIKAIHKKYGNTKIKTHKLISLTEFLYNKFYHKIEWMPFLDYVDYQKEHALCHLEKNYGYRRYPYKHYESVFTRFYQGYILPRKFGIDKRKLHLSNLIMTNQMSRDEALHFLSESPYPDKQQLKNDYDFVIKKLGYTDIEFQEYIVRPGVSHNVFSNSVWLWELLKKLHKFVTKK